MFNKILIANRGEIACRVIKTCRKMGIRTVAVHSDADRRSLHVRMADEAVRIGPPAVYESYISIERILEAVEETGSDAVHPGYGFLSENSEFAAAVEQRGAAFIGPTPSAIDCMGDKIKSKAIAAAAGVSTVPGHPEQIGGPDEAMKIAAEIGYPVMIKASAGGGGKGMRVAHGESELISGLQSARNEAKSSFGDDAILLERFVERPRHIEIQVLADGQGNCIHLNERECSIQRRNQKVIEEAPSPFLSPSARAAMGRQAIDLAMAVGYRSAGTVEFIVDSSMNFYFLEMNTRLQVEHPVTELITGIDLVEHMIRIAAGERLSLSQEDIGISGWAIESRIYAEDPYRGFLPSIGRLTRYRPPAEHHSAGSAIRNDTGVCEGGEISIHYDPMIAKLCSWGGDRQAAIGTMREALDRFEIDGISCNLPFLSAVMDNARFSAGEMSTAFIEEEYSGSFKGVEPDDRTANCLAAAAALMHEVIEGRRANLGGHSARSRAFPGEWAVQLPGRRLTVQVEGKGKFRFAGGDAIEVKTGWKPGDRLAEFAFDGEQLVLQVDRLPSGFRIRHRGADLRISVMTLRQAELSGIAGAASEDPCVAQLLCPMPGVLVSCAVSEGEEVQEGQPLCTVEAMKMENVLKAERSGKVKRILPRPGDSLAVNDVILEFE